MKLFVAFFGLLGLTSGLRLTFKQQLQNQLSETESQLHTAIQESFDHGLNFYTPIFERLLKELSQAQKTVLYFKDTVKESEIHSQVEELKALQKRIQERIENPSPSETRKIEALVHAGSQPSEDAQKIVDQVQKIVSEEHFLLQNPKNPKSNLEIMYKNLERSLSGWSLNSFPDFYGRANGTRMKIQEYRERGWIQESNSLEDSLKKFDNLTLQMAHKLPLINQYSVLTFYLLSREQFSVRFILTNAKSSGKSAKNEMLGTLDSLKDSLTKKIERYRTRAYNYYADVLSFEFKSIQNKKRELEKYPEFDVDRGQEYVTRRYLDSFVSNIQFQMEHPADEEAFKAGSLYLSAIISLKNQTGSESKITPKFIHDEVKKIFRKENTLISPGDSPYERLDKIRYNDELKHMRDSLRSILSAEYKVPVPGSHEGLEDDVQDKIDEIKGQGLKEKADQMEKELKGYVELTKKLVRLIPIDSDEKVDAWFKDAITHQQITVKFNEFIAEKSL